MMDGLSAYIRAIDRYPLLKPHEELELTRQFAATKDTRARTKLINSNLRLVVFIARKYKSQGATKGMTLLELIQEGCKGLIKGVDRFDPTKDCRLSTYVYWWIFQEITRAIGYGDIVRRPIYLNEAKAKISKAVAGLSQKLGRTPTKAEITQELDMDMERLDHILANTRHTYSLNVLVGDNDTELGDFLASDVRDPIEEVSARQDYEHVRELLQYLKPRDAQIISLYYGLDGPPHSLQAIGEMFGLSRERVRQRKSSALRTLKTRLTKYAPPPPPQLPKGVPVEPKSKTVSVTDLPKPETTQENTDMANRTSLETKIAIRKVLNEMIEAGTTLNQREVCELAGANRNYLTENLDMRGEYRAAIEQIKGGVRPDTAILQSRVNELEKALQQEAEAKAALQRNLAEQQEAIEGLRKQLLERGNRIARLEERQPTKLDKRGLLEALRELAKQEEQTIARCTQDLQDLQEQIEQARRDRAAAERHLETFKSQIERLEEQAQEQASTNGHHKVAVGA